MHVCAVILCVILIFCALCVCVQCLLSKNQVMTSPWGPMETVSLQWWAKRLEAACFVCFLAIEISYACSASFGPIRRDLILGGGAALKI